MYSFPYRYLEYQFQTVAMSNSSSYQINNITVSIIQNSNPNTETNEKYKRPLIRNYTT